ncbi:Xaa-Pro peptidase family protein [Mesorhizobium sp. M0960]|uniref:M24 family metallopeptidase n=1 Tax=Mesorhizobium sp. M0960 TaxID=2957035 RepID=UPI003339AC73
MAMTQSAIPLTGVPFPLSEYERRRQKVLEAVARAGLDGLLVTAHGHLRYLTGYDGSGGYFAPFPLVMVPGQEPTYVVREYDAQAVEANSCIQDIVTYRQQHDFSVVCADVLRRFGLESKKIGFEVGCWNLAPADVTTLQAQMPNMKVADATRLVASVAAVKSELELEFMRDAMAMTDVAVRAFQNSLREGVTETEVAAALHADVRRAGGEELLMGSLSFGERTKLPHGAPASHPIRVNEPAMVELGGTKHGYPAGLLRSAVLGRHAETEYLHALAVEALEAAIDVIKPGVTAGEVNYAASRVIEQSGRPDILRQRTGYQTGAPWTERGNISLEPGSTDVLQEGMTFHIPIILFGESGYLFGTGEHLRVTERSAETLSSTPHTLYWA